MSELEIDYNPGYEYQAELAVSQENGTWYFRTEDIELMFHE